MRIILRILIIIVSIGILVSIGWYFLLRDKSVSVQEAVQDILPFGSGDSLGTPTTSNNDENTESGALETSFDQFGIPTSNLFRITSAPVAGAVVFSRGNRIIVRYVDRATGHIYDTSLPQNASSTRLEKVKATNNTLPKIYEAYFRSDGTAALLRSLNDDSDTVNNFFLSLTTPTSTATSGALYNISSTILRGNVSAVAVGPGNIIFYTLKDASTITSSTFTGASTRTILSSKFTDWRLSSAGSRLIIYPKASASVLGYVYNLNTSSGALSKILGPHLGLSAIINPAGNRILYSYTEGNRTRLFTKNLQNNSVSETSIVTLAEKCIWSTKDANLAFCGAPDGLATGEPDHWYKGETHYADRVWRLNASNNIVQVVVEPTEDPGVDIDAIDLKLSPDESYLIFTNKSDLSLWALRLK